MAEVDVGLHPKVRKNGLVLAATQIDGHFRVCPEQTVSDDRVLDDIVWIFRIARVVKDHVIKKHSAPGFPKEMSIDETSVDEFEIVQSQLPWVRVVVFIGPDFPSLDGAGSERSVHVGNLAPDHAGFFLRDSVHVEIDARVRSVWSLRLDETLVELGALARGRN